MDAFYTKAPGRSRTVCKKCHAVETKAWLVAHPERLKHYRLKAYGISIEEFDSLLMAQSNACGICREVFVGTGKDGPYVDHNHDTGKVRSLLCRRCNSVLGMVKEDGSLLLAMEAYLVDNA